MAFGEILLGSLTGLEYVSLELLARGTISFRYRPQEHNQENLCQLRSIANLVFGVRADFPLYFHDIRKVVRFIARYQHFTREFLLIRHSTYLRVVLCLIIAPKILRRPPAPEYEGLSHDSKHFVVLNRHK